MSGPHGSISRSALRAWVLEELGDRQLVWFGTRGDDIESIADLPHLDLAFSLIAPYRRRTTIGATALEDLTGTRPDLDTYELDDHTREQGVEELRRGLLRALRRPSALVTYRPSRFLSAISFARRDRCRYLGMFKDHQFAFEHKPWVESAVADLGLPAIPWSYVADSEQLETVASLRQGSVLLRRSRTTGGVGLIRVDDPEDLDALWPDEDEAFVSVAPFLEGGVPVNVGAVAWKDGVTVHPASIQLIGHPTLTTRPFGFCGNDFGAVGDLGPDLLAAIERAVVRVGDWMRRHGYLGAFGVDFLVVDGIPLFTEVNPRFQGSTHLSCRLSLASNEPGILLEHVAALLGHAAPPYRPLARQAADHPRGAHAVFHWRGPETARLDSAAIVGAALEEPSIQQVDVVAHPGIWTEPGATVARVTTSDRLTTTGFDLVADWPGRLADLLRVTEPARPAIPMALPSSRGAPIDRMQRTD